jgi:hypothetical protein
MDAINITGIYHGTALGMFFLQNMFLIMSLTFIIFFLMLLLNLKDIRRQLSGIDRRTWAILLMILILGFALRNSSYMYGYGFDGIHYTESARTWLHTGIFMKGCAFGDLDSCRLYHQTLFPAGFPFMILLLYMAFGVNSLLPMALEGIISSLTIILVFLITRSLLNRNDIGLYSALVFSLIPVDVAIAGTGAVRPASLFFMGLTVLFFLTALGRNRLASWLLVAITLSLSIYMRQENSILLIPLLFLFMTRYKGDRLQFIRSGKFLLPAALFIATQIPVQHWILFMGGLGGSMPDFSLAYLPYHVPVMLGSLFLPQHGMATFNPTASLFFLLSAAFLFRRERREAAFLWIWFTILFMLYALYFHCPSLVCGDHIRYMHSMNIPYSILAGLSIFWIINHLRIKTGHGIALAFTLLFLTSGIEVPTTLFNDARLQEPRLGDQFIAISKTPPNCTIIIANYMAAGSDVLSEKRRWIDLDMVLADGGSPALAEMREAECLALICNSYINESPESEQNKFISQYLAMDFYFSQGDTAKAYNATLRRNA